MTGKDGGIIHENKAQRKDFRWPGLSGRGGRSAGHHWGDLVSGADRGILSGQGSEIWGCLAAVLVMVVLEYLSNTLGNWVKQMAQRRIALDIRRQLFDKSVYVDYLRLKARDSGDLNSLYLSDVDAIGQYYKTLMDSFGQITGGVAALLLCILISWKFLLVSLCVFPIMLALGELANKNLKRYAYDVQQKKGAAAASLLDAIRNRDMARSYTAQQEILITDVENIVSFFGTQISNFVTPIAVSTVCIAAVFAKSVVIAAIVMLSMILAAVINLYFLPRLHAQIREVRNAENALTA